jgi:hypothetical protein
MAKKSSTRVAAPKQDRAAPPAQPGRAVGNSGGKAVPKPNMPMKLPGMPNQGGQKSK